MFKSGNLLGYNDPYKNRGILKTENQFSWLNTYYKIYKNLYTSKFDNHTVYCIRSLFGDDFKGTRAFLKPFKDARIVALFVMRICGYISSYYAHK